MIKSIQDMSYDALEKWVIAIKEEMADSVNTLDISAAKIDLLYKIAKLKIDNPDLGTDEPESSDSDDMELLED